MMIIYIIQMALIQISKQSTFLFQDIHSFFSPSQVVDYYLGKKAKTSLQISLAMFQQNQYKLQSLAHLIYFIFKQSKDNNIKFILREECLQQLLENDGLKLLINGINILLQKMQEKDGSSLENQMALKISFNLIYVSISFIEENKSKVHSSQNLNQKYIDYKFDDILMKIITLSLEAHYIPIKKIVMLYAKVLSNLFYYKSNEQKSKVINPIYLYRDQTVIQLPQNNLLKYGQLEKYKISSPPPLNAILKEKVNSIEKFYRKHNSGECPLAQSIVVGLLRSLLTICNCQKHKKFQTVKGAGVDSFRQWQISYRYLFEHPEVHSLFPQWVIERMRAYEVFDQSNGQPQKGSSTFQPLQFEIWSQFYTHKIYTTTVITNFFFLILIALKQNMFIQYSYFLQLISDANGILVFLKFLTDKFSNLQNIKETIIFSNNHKNDRNFNFQEKAMLAIYGVLQMLFASCNNYPEKIRTYLFDYNSHFIIKKIPTLFLAKNGPKDEELNSSNLGMPSKQQLSFLSQEPQFFILNKLTQLCYDLLKIQIPFFSKKKKEDAGNMKMIIDIFCKYPKVNKIQQLSSFQKLLLKSKSGLVKQQKYITSVQEMKTIHNEYNNLYYWSNDFLTNDIRSLSASKPVDYLQQITNIQQWLQENLWKYYD